MEKVEEKKIYQSLEPKEKPETKFPKIACTVISIITLVTLVLGLILKSPMMVIYGVIPAALYEAWRTEGFYTKFASAAVLVLAVLEILTLKGLLPFEVAQSFAGGRPASANLGLTIMRNSFIFPALSVVFSALLIRRTFGFYTKWLSVLLLVSTVGLLYLTNYQAILMLIRTNF